MNEVTIRNMKGKGLPVRGNEIDTDRIIPARFMKCVTFAGLGAYAFNDERVNGRGESKGHPFDDERWAKHPIMVVNANFGCGSSREHAPQALKDYGIQAIIGESFAEIFAGNCSSLGMPALTLSHKDIEALQQLLEKQPDVEIEIDIDKLTVKASDQTWKASMSGAYRKALLDGSWDSTAVLASAFSAIDKVAESLPYVLGR